MVGIELVRDKKTKAAYPWEEKVGMRVCQEIRKRGVILRPLGNVIVLVPPLAISIKKLGYLLDMTYWAIDKVTNAK
jgi:adenosylmethionine-8-amino-7-oxononanoate aminotransferase